MNGSRTQRAAFFAIATACLLSTSVLWAGNELAIINTTVHEISCTQFGMLATATRGGRIHRIAQVIRAEIPRQDDKIEYLITAGSSIEELTKQEFIDFAENLIRRRIISPSEGEALRVLSWKFSMYLNEVQNLRNFAIRQGWDPRRVESLFSQSWGSTQWKLASGELYISPKVSSKIRELENGSEEYPQYSILARNGWTPEEFTELSIAILRSPNLGQSYFERKFLTIARLHKLSEDQVSRIQSHRSEQRVSLELAKQEVSAAVFAVEERIGEGETRNVEAGLDYLIKNHTKNIQEVVSWLIGRNSLTPEDLNLLRERTRHVNWTHGALNILQDKLWNIGLLDYKEASHAFEAEKWGTYGIQMTREGEPYLSPKIQSLLKKMPKEFRNSDEVLDALSLHLDLSADDFVLLAIGLIQREGKRLDYRFNNDVVEQLDAIAEGLGHATRWFPLDARQVDKIVSYLDTSIYGGHEHHRDFFGRLKHRFTANHLPPLPSRHSSLISEMVKAGGASHMDARIREELKSLSHEDFLRITTFYLANEELTPNDIIALREVSQERDLPLVQLQRFASDLNREKTDVTSVFKGGWGRHRWELDERGEVILSPQAKEANIHFDKTGHHDIHTGPISGLSAEDFTKLVTYRISTLTNRQSQDGSRGYYDLQAKSYKYDLTPEQVERIEQAVEAYNQGRGGNHRAQSKIASKKWGHDLFRDRTRAILDAMAQVTKQGKGRSRQLDELVKQLIVEGFATDLPGLLEAAFRAKALTPKDLPQVRQWLDTAKHDTPETLDLIKTSVVSTYPKSFDEAQVQFKAKDAPAIVSESNTGIVVEALQEELQTVKSELAQLKQMMRIMLDVQTSKSPSGAKKKARTLLNEMDESE